MLLGQLFHYLKNIDKISTPINSAEMLSLELAGLKKEDYDNLKNLSTKDLQRKIRDLFSQKYKVFLQQNKLSFAYNFWLNLTSPKKTRQADFKPSSEFQEKLLDWQKNDFILKDLEKVLEVGKLALVEEDVAIFYGLTVIHKLSDENPKKTSSLGLIPEPDSSQDSKKDLKQHPQLLVLTQNYKFPLFTNLNGVCLTVKDETEEKEVLDEIQAVIEQNQEISLILIDLLEAEKLIKYLQKNLPAGILVTSLGLEKTAQVDDGNSQTFFDKIVKQTLGVRLN